MLTPVTHASDSALPLAITSLSAFTIELFGLPFGAIVMALAGSLWAIWRNTHFTRWQSLAWWAGGVVAAIGLTTGTAELINRFFGWNPPLQWLAGLIAFLFVDKHSRDKIFSFFGAKAQGVEVKND